MKLFIPFIFACIVLSCMASTTRTEVKHSEPIENITYQYTWNNKWDADSCSVSFKDLNDHRPSRAVMIQEVINLWNLYYDKQGIKPHHKLNEKRKNFPKYAEYIVDATRKYQDNPTNLGGQLPKNRDTHLLIATMAALETGVDHTVVGWKRGEVGLLQVHGTALNGYNRLKVKEDAKLGAFLGVRWLAYHTKFCKVNLEGNINGWKKILSLYGAGLRAGRDKNGKCKEISVARRRVHLTKLYRSEIRTATIN